MKKTLFVAACLAGAIVLTSAGKKEKVMTKEKGAYVVNTTTLAQDVIGYEGPTPLKIYIRKNRVERIEALPNQETPKYWKAATKHLLEKWNGKKVKEAKEMKVDGRTGATFSSNALKENVKRGLEYYEQNK